MSNESVKITLLWNLEERGAIISRACYSNLYDNLWTGLWSLFDFRREIGQFNTTRVCEIPKHKHQEDC